LFEFECCPILKKRAVKVKGEREKTNEKGKNLIIVKKTLSCSSMPKAAETKRKECLIS